MACEELDNVMAECASNCESLIGREVARVNQWQLHGDGGSDVISNLDSGKLTLLRLSINITIA